jgi:hypothetical protein
MNTPSVIHNIIVLQRIPHPHRQLTPPEIIQPIICMRIKCNVLVFINIKSIRITTHTFLTLQ